MVISTLGTVWGCFCVSDWKMVVLNEWDQGWKHPVMHRTIPYNKESSSPKSQLCLLSLERNSGSKDGFWKEWEVNGESHCIVIYWIALGFPRHLCYWSLHNQCLSCWHPFVPCIPPFSDLEMAFYFSQQGPQSQSFWHCLNWVEFPFLFPFCSNFFRNWQEEREEGGTWYGHTFACIFNVTYLPEHPFVKFSFDERENR